MGQGKDYIYDYEGSFVGRRKKDVLNPTNHQKVKYGIENVADIFPKYVILRVGSFKEEKVIDTMDEWMYFLKKSEIKDEFTAKGMAEAKRVLRYENMQEEDKLAYKRHIENRRIEMSVTETAVDRGKRERSIEVAKFLLSENTSINIIIGATQLTAEEIAKIARGEELDKEEE